MKYPGLENGKDHHKNRRKAVMLKAVKPIAKLLRRFLRQITRN